jgi:hypothetical protein
MLSGARILVLWPGFRQTDFLAVLAAVDRASLDRLERSIAYGDNARPEATFPDGFPGKPVVPYATLRANSAAPASLASRSDSIRGERWRSTMTG